MHAQQVSLLSCLCWRERLHAHCGGGGKGWLIDFGHVYSQMQCMHNRCACLAALAGRSACTQIPVMNDGRLERSGSFLDAVQTNTDTLSQEHSGKAAQGCFASEDALLCFKKCSILALGHALLQGMRCDILLLRCVPLKGICCQLPDLCTQPLLKHSYSRTNAPTAYASSAMLRMLVYTRLCLCIEQSSVQTCLLPQLPLPQLPLHNFSCALSIPLHGPACLAPAAFFAASALDVRTGV
eukprot:1159375-Pelagomonas_calceolata.AAC.1